MQKRYGGVNNTKTLEEMEEADTYVKPPILHFNLYQNLRF